MLLEPPEAPAELLLCPAPPPLLLEADCDCPPLPPLLLLAVESDVPLLELQAQPKTTIAPAKIRILRFMYVTRAPS